MHVTVPMRSRLPPCEVAGTPVAFQRLEVGDLGVLTIRHGPNLSHHSTSPGVVTDIGDPMPAQHPDLEPRANQNLLRRGTPQPNPARRGMPERMTGRRYGCRIRRRSRSLRPRFRAIRSLLLRHAAGNAPDANEALDAAPEEESGGFTSLHRSILSASQPTRADLSRISEYPRE